MSDPRPLPVAWDGVPVAWSPWEPETLAICPPPAPIPCPGCGLIRTRSTSRGQGRTDIGVLVLYAWRCTHCGHDEVLDLVTGHMWDLDPLDYGPDGSRAVDGGARRG